VLSTWIQSKKDEEGFTLIELLVVVIIIGILAAIAIPVFLNQRQNAWTSAAESDARNAAIEIESYYTQRGEYPTALAKGTGAVAGTAYYAGTQNVTLAYTAPTAPALAYSIAADHTSLTGTINACYRSAAGGIQKPLPASPTCTP
jgi:type IV pilus assembly protein PilA